MPFDWNQHENLMMGARLANMARGGGGRRAELGSLLTAAPGADPLELAIAEHVQRQDEQTRERAFRKSEERDRWNRALAMQAREEATTDARDEKRFAREEPDRTLNRNRNKAELDAFKTTPREVKRGSEISGDAFAREEAAAEKRRAAERNQAFEQERYRMTGDLPADLREEGAAGGAGPAMNPKTREALTNTALLRAAQLRAEGREAEAQEILSGLGDVTKLTDAAMPKSKISPETHVQNVTNAAAANFKGDWTDTEPGDFWKAMEADPDLKASRDQAIVRLLKAGKSPAEIGYIARQSLGQQTSVPQAGWNGLDTGFFQNDKNAGHYYGELWRQHADRLLGAMGGAAN